MSALASTAAPITLGQLLPDLPRSIASLAPTDLSLDSRAITRGGAFVALPGTASDGRDYAMQALASGAAVVLAEAEGLTLPADPRIVAIPNLRNALPRIAARFFGDPSRDMVLVAVTGTNGKTSIVDFVCQLLGAIDVPSGSIGTLGARLGRDVTEAVNTTPDVLSINRVLAEWACQRVSHVAIEASSHALDQERLAGLTLHTGVFSNLSRDHFDYHDGEAAYASAKLKLFTDFDLKRAIYNADDRQARRVRELVKCPALGISLASAEADVYVQILDFDDGLRLRVHSPWGTSELQVSVSGAFNAFNLIAAIVVVLGLEFPLADVVAAAEHLQPVPGRMQAVPNRRGLTVIVDYAHTPDALSRALRALRPQTAGRLWVVFGCGGDRDPGKRPEMGAVAGDLADRIIVTSDNPRSEDPLSIIAQIQSGIVGACEGIADRGRAIRYAISEAMRGDTVLIAGKGHETYQEIAGSRRYFSDVDLAARALVDVDGTTGEQDL